MKESKSGKLNIGDVLDESYGLDKVPVEVEYDLSDGTADEVSVEQDLVDLKFNIENEDQVNSMIKVADSVDDAEVYEESSNIDNDVHEIEEIFADYDEDGYGIKYDDSEELDPVTVSLISRELVDDEVREKFFPSLKIENLNDNNEENIDNNPSDQPVNSVNLGGNDSIDSLKKEEDSNPKDPLKDDKQSPVDDLETADKGKDDLDLEDLLSKEDFENDKKQTIEKVQDNDIDNSKPIEENTLLSNGKHFDNDVDISKLSEENTLLSNGKHFDNDVDISKFNEENTLFSNGKHFNNDVDISKFNEENTLFSNEKHFDNEIVNLDLQNSENIENIGSETLSKDDKEYVDFILGCLGEDLKKNAIEQSELEEKNSSKVGDEEMMGKDDLKDNVTEKDEPKDNVIEKDEPKNGEIKKEEDNKSLDNLVNELTTAVAMAGIEKQMQEKNVLPKQTVVSDKSKEEINKKISEQISKMAKENKGNKNDSDVIKVCVDDGSVVCDVCGHLNKNATGVCEMCSNYLKVRR